MPIPKVIDISHYQVIPKDLMETAASGILGVIHKCTEGSSYVDDKCAARFYLTKQAGMRWGLYSFLRPGNQTNNARFFIDTAERLGVIDDGTLLAADHEADVDFDGLMEFLEEVEAITGRRPVIYSGHTIKDQCSSSNPYPDDYLLWLAHYSNDPTLPVGCEKYYLHQYTDAGHCPGIDGNVDLNQIQEGITDAEFLAMWSGGAAPVDPVLPEPEPGDLVVRVTVDAPPGVRVEVVLNDAETVVSTYLHERRIIGVVVVMGFFGTIGAYILAAPGVNELLSVLIGALSSAFAVVVNHYFSKPAGEQTGKVVEGIIKEEEADRNKKEAPPPGQSGL